MRLTDLAISIFLGIIEGATEFVPVSSIEAASALEPFHARDILGWADLPMFAIEFGISFGAAWVAVRFFVHLLATTTMRPFAWYRIAASLLLLGAIGAGWISS